MKSLLVLCVLLCAALSVRAAVVQTAEVVDVKEEDVAVKVNLGTQRSVLEGLAEVVEDPTKEAPVPFGSCPSPWHGYQGKCYLLVNEHRTWTDAEAHCGGMQASLASAHSFWEYSVMQNLARTAGHRYAWMGGYYFLNRWRWDDGTVYSYQNWYSQSSTSSNQCLRLDTYESRGWSNAHCSNGRYPSICSRSSTFC